MEEKNKAQKFYKVIDDYMPFKNASEVDTYRLKSMVGLMIGIIVATFFIFELFVGYKTAVRMGIIESIDMFEKEKPSIAIIDIKGPITNKTYDNVNSSIQNIKEVDQYPVVLFVIDSPGGSPTASEDIARAIMNLKETKRAYTFVRSIGASGGYYIACTGEKVFANPNAILGSIGVIMPHYILGALAKKIGVEEDHIVQGKYKVPISPLKKASKEQKEYLQDRLLSPVYKNFVNFVALNRGMSPEEVETLAQGQIFAATHKKIQGKLLDEVISYPDLIKKLKKEVSIILNVDKDDVMVYDTEHTTKGKNSFFNISLNIDPAKIISSSMEKNVEVQ